MNEVQNNILLKSRELFYRYGIRNVSMDDVAKHLSVSKKTIYDCFINKAALISAIATEFIAVNKLVLLDCNKQSSDAVEEVLLQVKESFTKLANINYTFFYEVERSFPAAWKILVNYRQATVLPHINANLERGIEEGLFRNDLDLHFTTDIRLQQLTSALTPGAFNRRKCSVYDVMRELTIFYLHGITTSKGNKLIDEYLNPSETMNKPAYLNKSL